MPGDKVPMRETSTGEREDTGEGQDDMLIEVNEWEG
jgi:hypothetical protein